MGKSQQRKGYRGENNLRRLLQDKGISCNRVPLSGASAVTPSCDLLIGENEDKAEVKIRGNGFKKLYDWLAGKDYLFIKADRKPYLVVMTLTNFIGGFRMYGSKNLNTESHKRAQKFKVNQTKLAKEAGSFLPEKPESMNQKSVIDKIKTPSNKRRFA